MVIGPESSSRYNFTYAAEEVRLKIQPVELEDEGTYNINVTNVAGLASDFVVVNVVSKYFIAFLWSFVFMK